MKQLRELMALADCYAYQSGLNNEYDNRRNVQEARDSLEYALRQAINSESHHY